MGEAYRHWSQVVNDEDDDDDIMQHKQTNCRFGHRLILTLWDFYKNLSYHKIACAHYLWLMLHVNWVDWNCVRTQPLRRCPAVYPYCSARELSLFCIILVYFSLAIFFCCSCLLWWNKDEYKLQYLLLPSYYTQLYSPHNMVAQANKTSKNTTNAKGKKINSSTLHI